MFVVVYQLETIHSILGSIIFTYPSPAPVGLGSGLTILVKSVPYKPYAEKIALAIVPFVKDAATPKLELFQKLPLPNNLH